MYSKKYLIIGLFLLFPYFMFSQESISYKNVIYKEGIKTVLFHKENIQFSYPIININEDEKLSLQFDDLNKKQTDYNYTIIHCNANWQPSDLNVIEYIDGFESDIIDDYDNSFNTLIQYKHYKLTIPNDDIKPLISGNYLLFVYEDDDKEKPVLTRRFYVVNSKIKIDAKVKRSSQVSTINDFQEIIFSVYDVSHIIFNPLDDMKVRILQNNIEDICIENVKPDFIKGDKYEFINSLELRFKGGNEYRYFNTKSTKQLNDRFSQISFTEPYYFFELRPEKSEARFPYTYAQDINGEMLITAEIVDEDDLEAEYVYVDFNLKYYNQLDGIDFYVFGALSDWQINEGCKMYYDFGEKKYKLRMLLKQGFYNYQYASTKNNIKKIDFSLIEGNYYETENNYVIYVYYRKQGSQYDELVGYKIVNSVKEL